MQGTTEERHMQGTTEEQDQTLWERREKSPGCYIIMD